MSNGPTDDKRPIIDWDAIVDDDPVVAEVRRIRYELAAEFGFDSERQYLGGKILAWACGTKYGNTWNPHTPPKEAELPELPTDLSGLIPNRERFIRSVRMSRSCHAKREPDLDAYNEDARHRARVLGFPEDAFVVSPSDFPPDFDLWAKQDAPASAPATSSAISRQLDTPFARRADTEAKNQRSGRHGRESVGDSATVGRDGRFRRGPRFLSRN